MGFRSYKGPVENLEQAMGAGVVLDVACVGCSHSRPMWAWRIYNWRGAKAAASIPLKKPVRGFYCKSCRRSATVILTRPGPGTESMCGKFTAMASWAEVVAFPSPSDWRRPQPIHARSESIDTTRAFAGAFLDGRRGVVLVKTFNEAPDSGQQHTITPEVSVSGIAFLWRRFEVAGVPAPLYACVMVTVPANALIASLPTDRMPAILDAKDWAKWTGEGPATVDELKAMLKTTEGVNWKMAREHRGKATMREPTGTLL